LKGHTPVITRGDSYTHLTAASAISEEGDLFYQLRTTAFKGKAMVLFLEKLLKSTRKKILLIWDGAPAHVSKEVKAFLASPKAKNRLWIEKLPPYSPELNPDERIHRAKQPIMVKD
jgi:transposase